MPGVDGYETAVLIRERPRSRQTPIIFLTANDWGVAARVPRLHGRRRRLPGQAGARPTCCARRWRCSSSCSTSRKRCASRRRSSSRGSPSAPGSWPSANVALSAEIEERVKDRAGARAAAAARAGGAPRGRSRQPAEGRVPGDAVARAAHAAQRHPGLGARAGAEQPAIAPTVQRAADVIRQNAAGAGAADRGHPRRLAHRRRPAGARHAPGAAARR